MAIFTHTKSGRPDIFLSDSELQKLNLRMGRDKDRVPIDFHRRRLRRIFNNGTFKSGGRFYHGWWQEVPSEYRSYIVINGEQTVEIDYSGIHFAMFYSDVGWFSSPEDPYALTGIDAAERKMVKKALNAMINASSEDEAIRAIRSEGVVRRLPRAYPTPEKLFEALREMHAAIQHLFGTGEGLKAQFKDSMIAERILLSFAKRQIPVLPVHDSFIVAKDISKQLEQEMIRIFEVFVQRACSWDVSTAEWSPPAEVTAEHKAAYSAHYARRAYWLPKLQMRDDPATREALERKGRRELGFE